MDRKGELLATARGHGLALVPARTRLDESGADFLALQGPDEAGAEWIARFPRRADVAERADVERAALALVAPRLPVRVPRWEIFSPALIAYPRLPGHPAAVVDPEAGGYVWRFDEATPPGAFLDTLAATLAALHAIDPELAAGAGLPVRSVAGVRELWAQRMERAGELLAVPDPVRRRWDAWLADDSYWPGRAALVHGDLHPGHLLVDEAHRLTGLIDWTEAQVGDPAADFALLHATLGRETLAGLLERYRAAGGEVGARMAEHVAESWAAYPALVAEFALLTGDEAPRQLGQYLLDATAREMEGA